MEDLTEAGLREGISEVIATTQSRAGIPNAAPVGILNSDGRYHVRLYRGSRTIANVEETRRLAVNVTMDALLFAKTLIGNLSPSDFSLFHGFPVLKEANSWILFRCNQVEEDEDSLLFMLYPLAVAVIRAGICAINRGLNAVIEAAILVSRWRCGHVYGQGQEQEHAHPHQGEGMQVQMQLARMRDYERIVARCGGRREKEAMQLLMDELYKTHH